MNRHGYSSAQWQAITDTLAGTHRLRVRAGLLDLNRHYLASLTPMLVDGQIDMDTSAQVSRRATIVLDDERSALPFDSDSPASGALWFDRMIRIACDVLTDAHGWLTLVPFTGPVVGLARDGTQVTVTCDGMERLALGNTWTVLSLDRGMKKTDAIRRIMHDLTGETQFNIPDLPTTLPNPITLTPDDVPWVRARSLARSMDRQLFYTGEGVLTLRRWPSYVVFEFTGARHVLSSPQVTAPTDFANAARVIGHDPKGPTRQLVAQAVATGTMSPAHLGRNGVGRYLLAGGSTIESDSAKTRAEITARANRELSDALRQPVQVTFDSLPVPGTFLDPGDMCRVSIDEGAVTFRLWQSSMPLKISSGQGMSVGYCDYRMGRDSRTKTRVYRRPPSTGNGTGDGSGDGSGDGTGTLTGRVMVVFTANVGDRLAADVASTDSAFTVTDTSDFDQSGTVRVGGAVVDYTAVNDDTGVVDIAGTVGATAQAGDPVSIWDTDLDQPAVEHRAHVDVAGQLDNADTVNAGIRHALIPYLKLGVRAPGTGESVRMERQGSEWVIVDILGKHPDMQSGYGPPGDGGGGGGSGSFVVVIHGDDGTVARPDADCVYWVGFASPDNGLAYDFWFTATL